MKFDDCGKIMVILLKAQVHKCAAIFSFITMTFCTSIFILSIFHIVGAHAIGADNISGRNTASLLATHFLNNVAYLRKVTEMDCSLRLYMHQNEEGLLLTLATLSPQGEPLELYFNDNVVRVHPPNSKYKSCCWHTLITVSAEDEPILQEKQLGNPYYDQFTFLSENGAILEKALTKSQVINKVIWKYGMYPTTTQNSNGLKISYLLEPSKYKSSSFIQRETLTLRKKFNNLNGRTLKSPIFHLSPFLITEKANNTTRMRGSHYTFTLEITKRANFSVEFYSFGKFEVGKRLPNGSYTGLLGEMINGPGEYCAVMGQVATRYHLVTFTTFSYRETMIFCVKSAEPLLHWHALVFPLSKTVWIFTLAALGSFVGIFIGIVSCKLIHTGSFKAPLFLDQGMFLPFALFLEQNCKVPTEHSPRIAAISLIWMAFVIATVYKTNLVGYLTFPEKQPIPTNFKQLNEHNEYQVHLFTVSIEVQMLKMSPSPVFQGLVKKLRTTGDVKDCVMKATRMKSACIMWGSVMQAAIMKNAPEHPEINELYETQESATYVDICVGVKKNSVYYEVLNRYTGYAREAGLIAKWLHDQKQLERDLALEQMKSRRVTIGGMGDIKEQVKRHETKELMGEAEASEEKPLKVENLIAVALAYAFGCGVATVCFVLEGVVEKVVKKLLRFIYVTNVN